MERRDTTSFAKFWENKVKVAGSLGYDNVAEFRMFRFNHIVLDWFLIFNEHYRGKGAKSPFTLLQDIPQTEEFSLRDTDALFRKYLTQGNMDKEQVDQHKDYIYATILLRLAENIAAMSSPGPVDSIKQQESQRRFEEQEETNI